MEVFVFSDRRLSSMNEWQRAIDSDHLGIVLPVDDSLDGLRGYLPIHHHGKKTGFECRHRDAAEIMTFLHDVDLGQRWSQCLCFIWGGDLDEGLAASMASAAYAKAAEGIVYDPQDNVIMSPREALDLARRMEDELPKAKQIVAEAVKKL
jgi:hypothetical protein